ncbi:MAG: NAD(P)/FAD-dependent oxidoreductase [Christensenellales bacterium]|jgi:predicted Rossmann fold flavoprotein
MKDGSKNVRVLVIGAGAAGMMAAAAAAENGADVTLIEKNEKCGKKIYITGKGRCNVTNVAAGDEFLKNIPRNPRFLMSALSRFDSAAAMDFLESAGLKLKVERGGRVFPVSEKASDVTKALQKRLEELSVELLLNTNVEKINVIDGRVSSVTTNRGEMLCDSVIVCTGGCSYPTTGSTGDGWLFAEQTGHRTLPPLPSLLPVETNESWVRALQGLTLKNVSLKAVSGKKTFFDQQGEMLFTHFGIGGPLVLTLSSVITGMDFQALSLFIDMKPALDMKTLEDRFLRDMESNKNRWISNAMEGLLPKNMIAPLLDIANVPQDKPVNQVSKQDRLAILGIMKGIPLTVKSLRPLNEAVITRGGVHVGDIDPKTMQSKKVKGLFFAGELLDVDGFTGGFNLQIAFTTGYCAGVSAADN